MPQSKFILRNKDEVRSFERLLDEYFRAKTRLGPLNAALVKAFEELQSRSDGGRVFSALLDIWINFVCFACDTFSIGAIWNDRFSKGKLEGGSVLDSREKFFGKMEIHRFSSSSVLRYRALWDKIMGLIVLIFCPDAYSRFWRSKSRKKAFAEIIQSIPEVPPDFVTFVHESLTYFDDVFRTPEAHGTGSLRKWTFLMEELIDNPLNEVLGSWNPMHKMMREIGKLFQDNVFLGSHLSLQDARQGAPEEQPEGKLGEVGGGRTSGVEGDTSQLVKELYTLVGRFEESYPGRRFTPDGHLVGSIGEVLAAYRYNLQLLPASTESHDARAPDGRYVQIKATQRDSIGLRSEPQHLLVLKLNPDGSADEVYNGPGKPAWNQARKRQSNGQRSITVAKLKAIMQETDEAEILPVVND